MASEEAAKELPGEGEVLHLRENLDWEILPTKAVAEHADHGQAHCKLVKRGLGNTDGNLPFR